MKCPCQSGASYESCCGRFITHQLLPENAQQLMRSRFSAYVLNELEYLKETWEASYRPAQLQLGEELHWLKLDIIDTRDNGNEAVVEFEAMLLVSGQVDALHERSRFVRQQGRWLYTTGDMLLPSFEKWKPGRNEACPCGSGKKFKRCCAA